jgi:hypothetical protein
MGSNTTAGAIARYRKINATLQPDIFFSRGDAGILLTDIPANTDDAASCVVTLPDSPGDGDCYELYDQDGSCNASNLVVVVPGALPLEQTIQTLAGTGSAAPFFGLRFTYSTEVNDWVVSSSAGALQAIAANAAGTFVGGSSLVTPGNLASAAANPILCAFTLKPTSTGVFRLMLLLKLTMSASDTLTVTASAESGLSAAPSGGSFVGGFVAPTFQYEVTGGGGQITVPSTTSTLQATWERLVPAAEIGNVTVEMACTVNVPEAGAHPSAIQINIGTAGATAISAMSLNASAQEML